jgi:HlyD family secretion protein
MAKLILIPLVLIGVAIAGATPAGKLQDATHTSLQPRYQLAQVSRGKAITRVIAAGAVQPVLSVVVGSQVSGQLKEILADFNDVVKKDQPLARLDPQLFETRAQQARAEVNIAAEAVRIARDEVITAEAIVKRTIAERTKSEAEKERSQVTVENAQRRLDRKSHLMTSGSSSVSETDDARTAYAMALAELSSAKAQVVMREIQIEEAKAQLAVARSRVAHTEAHVRRSQAALRQAEADLERTVIRSPMDGIVIERSVTAGQTVAASFQAPTLFSIGDLRAVSVEIAVDEADVGHIRAGQQVTFTVDAYSDRIFTGSITQVRKAPHTQDNVVTYTVLAVAANDELLLLPGMTAKAEIMAGERPNALQVPTATLRYRPQALPHPSGSHVWVFDGAEIHPVPVQVGVTGGGVTEIVRGDLVEEQQVVVSEVAPLDSGATAWRSFGITVAGWIQPVQSALAGLAQR